MRTFFQRFALPPLLFWCSLALASCIPVRGLGDRPSEAERQRFSTLKQHNGSTFFNHPDYFGGPAAPRRKKKFSVLRMARFLMARPEETRPEYALPVVPFGLDALGPDDAEVVWFGHSTVLVRAGGATVLFDPVFRSSVGPYKGAVPAFTGTHIDPSKDLPPIDAVVISHDHYDHLDYPTLRRLRKKIRRIIAPLGVAAHLRKWGFADSVLHIVNWQDSVRLNAQVSVMAVPAFHRSGRRFRDNETLWASYVLKAGGRRIYFSGDTGYSGHFAAIGKQYGPIDLALLECGQYNEKWPHSHMFPEQTAQAAADLGARVLLPIHWAKFAESEHPWNEPVQRLLRARPAAPVVVPMIGQPLRFGTPFQQVRWWE
ncbi:MBL fold metallo-hydrolase [Flaviaesturariibacter amylovorans]|uniref:MBL fold metallo-hydrolase n=1 Tax=Flaviaesturariibacter amylovorans TaxID=1084520 RepID=A0ABP8H7X4_9BACT